MTCAGGRVAEANVKLARVSTSWQLEVANLLA
jgi:hypothetical protein